MKMEKINTSAIITLINIFDYSMLDDSEWEELTKINPSDEKQLLEIFNQRITPRYQAMDSMSQQLIKSSLAAALSSPHADFQKILDRVEMPFEPIEDPRQFFSLLWHSLFQDNSR